MPCWIIDNVDTLLNKKQFELKISHAFFNYGGGVEMGGARNIFGEENGGGTPPSEVFYKYDRNWNWLTC